MHRFWNSITGPLLEILQPTLIAEIGIYEGKQTELLLQFAKEHNAVVHAIDPEVVFPLESFERNFGEQWRFHRATSIEAIPTMPLCDVYFIDGDHNWYTVYRELMLLEEKAEREGRFPVVLFHDTEWPYARRDMYYFPEKIPALYRKPHARQGIVRGQQGLSDDGFNPFMLNALEEGTAQNGVLTAIEDFLKRTMLDLRFVNVPGRHGLGILVPRDLCEKRNGLTAFLDSLDVKKNLRTHIESLEQERISNESLLHTIEQRNREEYAEEIQRLTDALTHLEQTRSWKWTEPMRAFEAALQIGKKRGPARGAIAIGKALWTMCGRPLSGPIRTFRHGILGGMIPAEPTAEDARQKIEDTKRAIEDGSKDSRPVYRLDVFVYEGDEQALSQTLRSIARQTIKPESVVFIQKTAHDLPEDCLGILPDMRIMPLREVETVLDAAAREMTAGYVMLIESGNILHPDYLRKGCDILQKRPDAALAAGDCFIRHSQQMKHALVDVSPVLRNSILFKALQREHMRNIPQLWRMIVEGGAIVAPINETIFTYDDSAEALGNHESDDMDVTLCLALSGRTWMWPHTRAFLERQTYDAQRMHLIVMDTSQNDAFAEDVRTWVEQSPYGKTTFIREIVGEPGIADKPRNEAGPAVTNACVQIYNKFATLTTTPTVCILEDDVIPPDDAFVRLSKHLTSDVLSVSGVYRHRMVPEIVVWDWSTDDKPVASQLKNGVLAAGGNGFGCVAMQGSYFSAMTFSGSAPLFNFDFNFYHHAVLVEKRIALVDWNCRCKHYVHADHWVTPL